MKKELSEKKKYSFYKQNQIISELNSDIKKLNFELAEIKNELEIS